MRRLRPSCASSLVAMHHRCSHDKASWRAYMSVPSPVSDAGPASRVAPVHAPHQCRWSDGGRRSFARVRYKGPKSVTLKEPDPNIDPLPVAIVGRANVGKSTLFNRMLSGTERKSNRDKQALVTPRAGTTRDRREEVAVFGGLQLKLIDTGGLEDERVTNASTLLQRMREQVQRSFDEVACVLFVIDAQKGITPLDQILAKLVNQWIEAIYEEKRRIFLEQQQEQENTDTGLADGSSIYEETDIHKPPVVLLANKADGSYLGDYLSDCYLLDLGEPIVISAERNEGLDDLYNRLVLEIGHLQEFGDESEEEEVNELMDEDQGEAEDSEDDHRPLPTPPRGVEYHYVHKGKHTEMVPSGNKIKANPITRPAVTVTETDFSDNSDDEGAMAADEDATVAADATLRVKPPKASRATVWWLEAMSRYHQLPSPRSPHQFVKYIQAQTNKVAGDPSFLPTPQERQLQWMGEATRPTGRELAELIAAGRGYDAHPNINATLQLQNIQGIGGSRGVEELLATDRHAPGAVHANLMLADDQQDQQSDEGQYFVDGEEGEGEGESEDDLSPANSRIMQGVDWMKQDPSLMDATQRAAYDALYQPPPAKVFPGWLNIRQRKIPRAEIRNYVLEVRRRQLFNTRVHISVIGPTNTGKSTLVNAILKQERVIVDDAPHTTMDSIGINTEWSGHPICITDTHGLTRGLKARHTDYMRDAGLQTYRNVRRSQVCILCVDASKDRHNVGSWDVFIGHRISEAEGRAMVIAINKWDLVQEDQRPRIRAEILDRVRRKFSNVKYCPVVFISAKQGHNIATLMNNVMVLYKRWNARVPTSRLNTFLREFMLRWPPPWRFGSKCNVKYITQVKPRPPTFVMWSNVYGKFPWNYLQQLRNAIRDEFRLDGTPMRIVVRTTAMPKPHVRLSKSDVLKWKRMGPRQAEAVRDLNRRGLVKAKYR
ncbi:unnamed protein product [Vitrella brassicaformis CCMP3155]|uniref:GTPase Der n=1 Tax=Vitrella brassicaformis (strain CCMP3155) TaxID=1169540 RepID=A0A0G4FVV5_VITBC|nr:unnamed protein product [Vitrella brassicaformis CCMP3155]|eukprot:CEM18734.1 unnamed protein product [Vitrella brassicaformis CCMP3155]